MKYYFGYYIYNGSIGSFKRDSNTVPSPGMIEEREITAEEFKKSLLQLSVKYPCKEFE